MNSTSNLSLPSVITSAVRHRDEFSRLLAGIPYERKGILYSEMFFLWLCASPFKPKRILESGRARGQSTLILSRTFPDAEIISIEYDRNSPDVPVAAERLKNCKNVQLLFGDATKLLPDMVRIDDVVLIDGPKGFRGLRLVLSLLGSRKPSLVLMHDPLPGSPERDFLEQHLPQTLYSDAPSLAAQTHHLDLENARDLPEALRFGPTCQHYGYSLAAMVRPADYSASLLQLKAVWKGFVHRLGKKQEDS
jgi:Putative methyltransferase